MRIACIGEAMIELALSGDHAAVAVAGDTLNTAVYLKRSAPELSVDYVSRLGTDQLSDKIREFIASEDIGTSRIERDHERTPGLYAISVDCNGERTFTYWRDTSAARDLFQDQDFSALDGYDVIYLSGISLAILPHPIRRALVRHLARSSAKVAFDSNYRARLWHGEEATEITREMWEIADIALPSLDDEMALLGESEAEVVARFALLKGKGALKRGAKGPLPIGEPADQRYTPAARIIDTTAAGDSFNGAYLAAILAGKSQAEALQAGHRLASHVIGFHGAIIPKNQMPAT
jgi:2-dehydro-3-deoxygluconokinase